MGEDESRRGKELRMEISLRRMVVTVFLATALCAMLSLFGCGGEAKELAKGDPNAPAHACTYIHDAQRDVYVCQICGKESNGEGLVAVD